MKLYYPNYLYDAAYRGQLFPLLKAFLKEDSFTNDQRMAAYGVSDADFILIKDIEHAEVVILPMTWYYYARTNQMESAYDLIAEAQQHNKIVWSYNAGDFGVKLPHFTNLIVFRQGGYVATKQLRHTGFPSIISDYVKQHHLEAVFLNSSYGAKPIVGFCGQANPAAWNGFKEMTKQCVRNIKSVVGFSFWEQQRILSSSYLRASLLKKLEDNTTVESHFIKRKQYRAGVTHNKASHPTTSDFYNNILESQYVLCVRGAGNFSVRFYETLMMGRIPLYVHTDGYLPLNEDIDWKAHLVWVDYKDRHQIGDILLEFHQKLDQEDLVALFKKNRKLWEDKLTLSGFFEAQKRKL